MQDLANREVPDGPGAESCDSRAPLPRCGEPRRVRKRGARRPTQNLRTSLINTDTSRVARTFYYSTGAILVHVREERCIEYM